MPHRAYFTATAVKLVMQTDGRHVFQTGAGAEKISVNQRVHCPVQTFKI
jgi:hypothetical protein